ncbi:PaaI family thioesterase [uncultured Dysosmobacter sp.]|uniref:PaaI family thioesterase n=1 Tax=uncultured Dysosmobacter sp. TaxID=2591384 RepID=UPI002631145E|nr:PaaI family thioesterase [uncultured Dysosmobacter sp.]
MDLKQLWKYCSDDNAFGVKLGFEVEEIRRGYAVLKKTILEDDLNSTGIPHGGVYLSIADSCAGTAMASLGNTAVTCATSYNYFKSARVGDTIFAEAKMIKEGGRMCVFNIDIKDQHGNLLGNGSSTLFNTGRKIEDRIKEMKSQ